MASRAEIDAWIVATSPRAVAYARSLLKDPHAAEDVVQDCYCRLLEKAHRYDLPADGQKLLMTAVTNACINHATRRRAGPPMENEPPDAYAASVVESVQCQELQEALEVGLRQLPEPQRAAVQLKALGYTQQEIGEMLSVSTTNAGVLIHRARQTLARLLERFLHEEVKS